MIFGSGDLRTFCRQMGVPVSFQGTSTYPDDEQPIMGLFDASGQDATFGTIRAEDTLYTLELPYDAFNPMPDVGDVISVLDGIAPGDYLVRNPTALTDGSMVRLELKRQ